MTEDSAGEPKSQLFKIIFEGVDSTAYFYVNGIEEMLSQEYFNRKIGDAKSGEVFTLKERIEKQLATQPRIIP